MCVLPSPFTRTPDFPLSRVVLHTCGSISAVRSPWFFPPCNPCDSLDHGKSSFHASWVLRDCCTCCTWQTPDRTWQYDLVQLVYHTFGDTWCCCKGPCCKWTVWWCPVAVWEPIQMELSGQLLSK
jgi:hypothetical protein